ncbi:hypothetical protein L209DRAFT_330257 [Thermothelomyces heterothallicus CBS 203.75]
MNGIVTVPLLLTICDLQPRPCYRLVGTLTVVKDQTSSASLRIREGGHKKSSIRTSQVLTTQILRVLWCFTTRHSFDIKAIFISSPSKNTHQSFHGFVQRPLYKVSPISLRGREGHRSLIFKRHPLRRRYEPPFSVFDYTCSEVSQARVPVNYPLLGQSRSQSGPLGEGVNHLTLRYCSFGRPLLITD